MNKAQASKVVGFQGPATVATNATSATNVDTLGWDYATVSVYCNPATASNSSAKWTALQLMHGTTTDASNHSAVSGAIGTTNSTAATTAGAVEFVLPEHNNTAASGVVRFYVDLTSKERYLRINKQAAASHHTTANVCELSRGAQPTTDAGLGVSEAVWV